MNEHHDEQPPPVKARGAIRFANGQETVLDEVVVSDNLVSGFNVRDQWVTIPMHRVKEIRWLHVTRERPVAEQPTA